MPLEWTPEAYVAAYAAVVSTLAIALEVRRWWTSGPQLKMRVIEDGVVIGGEPGAYERGVVIVTVVNRGDQRTTIKGLGAQKFDSRLARWRKKPSMSVLFPNSQHLGYPPNVPHVLEPGEEWTGIARPRPDKIGSLRDGTWHIRVEASHTDKPLMRRLSKKASMATKPELHAK
ncbi:hypothetical protein [Kaistia sp. UC242_56]|uniref:hypothetical protein n=1 Tax=Kaistia sp. UC242_56 TaxID=3374625 RepID=UPI003791A045